MNEEKIAKSMVKTFNIHKKQDPKTIGYGSKITQEKFANCDFDKLDQELKKLNFDLKIENIDKHKMVVIYPSI